MEFAPRRKRSFLEMALIFSEDAPMTANPTQVIVTTGFTPQAVQVYHRVIPELHAEGETPESAATNLAQDLARQIESLADQDRREMFLLALADVQAFINTTP
jgi:hypothetical protein